MKKRILSFVLALVLAVSLLPVSVLAAEDARFVLKADGQAVAVEKTPITGYTGGGRNDSATFPIYRASIYESTQKVQFEAKDSNIWYIADHTWGRPFSIKKKQNLPLSLLLRSTYAYVVDVTNTDTAKGPVFTLEGGKAITDVIDTTAKKTAYMEFTDGAKAFYGLILEIKAGSAPVEDESEFPYKGTPVVTYTKAGDANVSTAALKRIGTRTLNDTVHITKGKTWLVSLPAGATINDVNFGETVSQKKLQLYCVFDKNGTERYLKRVGKSTLAAVLKEAQTAGNYIVNEKFDLTLLGVDLDKPNTIPVRTTTLFEGKSIPTSGVKGFIVVYYDQEVANEAVIIQIDNTVDTAPLQAAINAAPKAEDGKYYTSGDRYNGKAADTILNDKNVGWDGSFWKEYQKVLTRAKEALDTADSQEKLDAAAAALQAAIAKLIPTDRVNATALYETVTGDWVWQPNGPSDYALRNKKTEIWGATINSVKAVSADNTTPGTYAAFLADKAQGEALLAQLYDESGNPTAANTADKQVLVNKLGAATSRLIHVDIYDRALKYFSDHKAEAQASPVPL